MEKETYYMRDLVDGMIELLEIDKEAIMESEYPQDEVNSYVDNQVPIMYYDIIQYAANDTNLATDEPELGPAFGGEATPVNIIAGNIYERLSEAAHTWLNEQE